MHFNYIQLAIVFSVLWAGANCLECYVCDRQENNHEKCLNNIHICEQGEEMCMTEVHWGTMPYWQTGGDKQYFVSKKCATKQFCEKTRSRLMPLCTYIWYQDWTCSHCCSGDRCNYHVILGASSNQVSKTIIGISVAVAGFFYTVFPRFN